MFELKRLSTAAIPAALAKAERYRLLNEPEAAQSICDDILTADADNFDAVRMLILALTDTFPKQDGSVSRAQELVARLPSEYERAYFGGLVCERRARALLAHKGPGGRSLPAGNLLREAMKLFERAEDVKPADNDDALLRWNSCARLFERHPELAVIDDQRTAPVMLE